MSDQVQIASYGDVVISRMWTYVHTCICTHIDVPAADVRQVLRTALEGTQELGHTASIAAVKENICARGKTHIYIVDGWMDMYITPVLSRSSFKLCKSIL